MANTVGNYKREIERRTRDFATAWLVELGLQVLPWRVHALLEKASETVRATGSPEDLNLSAADTAMHWAVKNFRRMARHKTAQWAEEDKAPRIAKTGCQQNEIWLWVVATMKQTAGPERRVALEPYRKPVLAKVMHELCGKVGDDGVRKAAYRGG